MPRLHLITRPDLDDANALIEAACRAQGIECRRVDPDAAQHEAPRRGELLYAAATDAAAVALEARWWRADLGSVYGPRGPGAAADAARSAKLARPRVAPALPEPRRTSDVLAAVAAVGGFPVVLKVPGGEGGRGVLRADSMPSLLSLLDYVPRDTAIVEFFAHVLAYRLVVVEADVVAAEAWCPGAYDFRSNAGGVALGPVTPPAAAVQLALDAAAALGVGFAGVDVMQNEAGALRLAEANCPCRFVELQASSGVDIAGRLVAMLHARAQRAA